MLVWGCQKEGKEQWKRRRGEESGADREQKFADEHDEVGERERRQGENAKKKKEVSDSCGFFSYFLFRSVEGRKQKRGFFSLSRVLSFCRES